MGRGKVAKSGNIFIQGGDQGQGSLSHGWIGEWVIDEFTTAWTDKKDSEIAKDIGQRTDNGRKRFPLPVVVDDNALGKEKPIPLVTQHNQYDIDFLFQRARMRGYVVFVQEEDRTTGRKRQLYFGPSQAGMIPGLRDVSFELRWGASLMEFRPKITTANQVSSVTVHGWHRTRKTAIPGR